MIPIGSSVFIDPPDCAVLRNNLGAAISVYEDTDLFASSGLSPSDPPFNLDVTNFVNPREMDACGPFLVSVGDSSMWV